MTTVDDESNPTVGSRHPEQAWIYRDAFGTALYRVVRRKLPNGKKTFVTQHPDGDRWEDGAPQGVERVPYRLPELIKATEYGWHVAVCEGERNADDLQAAAHRNGWDHLIATTSAGGASWEWPDSWGIWFQGATTVFVFADNDPPGIRAAKQRSAVIAEWVPDTRVIWLLPGLDREDGADVGDYLNRGGSWSGLVKIMDGAESVVPLSSQAFGAVRLED